MNCRFLLSLSGCLLISLSNSLFAQKYINTDNVSFDALNYTIKINNVDFEEKTLEGESIMTCRALLDSPQCIELDFISMLVDEVTVNDEDASFVQSDTSLIVTLPDGIMQGDEITIATKYGGSPFCESWGGVHFSGDFVYNLGVGINTVPHNLGRSWYPCIDNFHDKATFEYFVSVTPDKKAVCGGVLQDVIHNEDGTDTYHWKSDIPLATYTASFAIGPYILVEDMYHSEISGRDIPITYYVRDVDTAKIETMFQNIHQITNLFETKFGPYHFERIGYVATSNGAMEHQNNVAFPYSCLTNDLTYEPLYAHELFHSWFGNLVTCASAEDMWINEGWATFAESYYKEVLYGRDVFAEDLNALKINVLTKAHQAYEDNGFFPLNEIPQYNTYGISSYDRGCLVVQSLRDYLGDDVFFSAVTEMLQNNKFTFMSSEDMCAELTEITGHQMEDFFQNFVYQPGASAYVIDSCIVTDSGADNYTAEVHVQQKLYKRDNFTFSHKVNVCFMRPDLSVCQKEMRFSGDYKASATFELDFNPIAVFIDYFCNSYDAKMDGEKMFKSAGQTTFKNTFFKVYVEDITDSTYCHVTHYLVEPNDTDVEGYILSSTHHWKVDVVKFGDIEAKAMFNYSKNNLDSVLLDGTNNVVLMYRANHQQDWSVVPTTQNGGNSVGDLVLEELVSGEYTFAIVDTTYHGLNDNSIENKIKIYPNPSSDFFKFDIQDNISGATLYVYNSAGQMIDKVTIGTNVDVFTWACKEDYVGYYTFRFVMNDGTVDVLRGIKVVE